MAIYRVPRSRSACLIAYAGKEAPVHMHVTACDWNRAGGMDDGNDALMQRRRLAAHTLCQRNASGDMSLLQTYISPWPAGPMLPSISTRFQGDLFSLVMIRT